MEQNKDKALTVEQIQTTVSFLDALRENNQLLNPVAWKQKAIKLNYVIAIIPAAWAMGGAFGINVGIDADQAVKILQFLGVAFPIWHNIVLSLTSKNVTMNPLANDRILEQRSRALEPDFNDSDE